VDNTLEVALVFSGCMVVEKEHGAIPTAEVLLQSEDLSSETKWVTRKKTEFGERIKDHSLRLHLFDLRQYSLYCLSKLNLSGV
jgi:hypothetical protein